MKNIIPSYNEFLNEAKGKKIIPEVKEKADEYFKILEKLGAKKLDEEIDNKSLHSSIGYIITFACGKQICQIFVEESGIKSRPVNTHIVVRANKNSQATALAYNEDDDEVVDERFYGDGESIYKWDSNNIVLLKEVFKRIINNDVKLK